MATLERAALAAFLSLLLLAGFAGAAAARPGFAPTPTGPVYGGVPGALPPRFAYVYDSGYRGWPVAPTHVQHPVRRAFLDPRGADDTGLSGYHFGRHVWVNPLHRGGRIAQYVDTAAPVVNALVFVTPPSRPWLPTKTLAQPDTATRLAQGRLHGLVELRANIGDPQSFLGFLADNRAWPTVFTPYGVSVTIRAHSSGRVVMSRTSFRADQLPQTPYIVHYAPGTIEDANMKECVGPPQKPACAGTYWLRPFSRFGQEYWNTRATPNGRYDVTVHAGDLAGNSTTRTITVSVRN